MPFGISRGLAQVNFVVDYWMDPCLPDPWIMIQTAFEASPHLFLPFLDVSSLNILRSRARPRDDRGTPDLRGRPGRRRGVGQLPDPGNILGRATAGFPHLRPPDMSDGLRHLWRLDAAIQRGLLALLFVDAVTDFAYEWTSLMMFHEVCQDSDRPMISGTFSREAWNHFFWAAPLTWDSVESRGNVSSTGTIFRIVDQPSRAVATASFTNVDSNSTTVNLRLTVGTQRTAYGFVSLEPGQAATLTLAEEVPQNAAVMTEVYTALRDHNVDVSTTLIPAAGTPPRDPGFFVPTPFDNPF